MAAKRGAPKKSADGGHPDDWRPNPGPQTRFLSLTCREALYGGQAGGGKSEAGLMGATRFIGQGFGARYNALLIRRTYTELEKSLIQRSFIYYPRLGGKYNGSLKCWLFPEGERVWLGHCEHENDVLKYKSDEFQYIFLDELTSFTEKQYIYLAFSRMRSAHGIPIRVRAGTNPGDIGHEWVFKRWGAWLDPKCPDHANPGEVVRIIREGDKEIVIPATDPRASAAITRCFVPAGIADNPHIAANGEYVKDLNQLDLVTRSQLRDGNWLIKPGKGLFFKRHWFEIVGEAPAKAARCRFWDRAATEDGGDWTVGVKMSLAPDGTTYVEDVIRFQGSPGRVETTILQTAQMDGASCSIGLSIDPGAAGKFEADVYARKLRGYHIIFIRESKDKQTRARPLSSQAERRLVKVVKGNWNLNYLAELEGFPEWANDDQVDASTGCHECMNRTHPVTRRVIPIHLVA